MTVTFVQGLVDSFLSVHCLFDRLLENNYGVHWLCRTVVSMVHSVPAGTPGIYLEFVVDSVKCDLEQVVGSSDN